MIKAINKQKQGKHICIYVLYEKCIFGWINKYIAESCPHSVNNLLRSYYDNTLDKSPTPKSASELADTFISAIFMNLSSTGQKHVSYIVLDILNDSEYCKKLTRQQIIELKALATAIWQINNESCYFMLNNIFVLYFEKHSSGSLVGIYKKFTNAFRKLNNETDTRAKIPDRKLASLFVKLVFSSLSKDTKCDFLSELKRLQSSRSMETFSWNQYKQYNTLICAIINNNKSEDRTFYTVNKKAFEKFALSCSNTMYDYSTEEVVDLYYDYNEDYKNKTESSTPQTSSELATTFVRSVFTFFNKSDKLKLLDELENDDPLFRIKNKEPLFHTENNKQITERRELILCLVKNLKSMNHKTTDKIYTSLYIRIKSTVQVCTSNSQLGYYCFYDEIMTKSGPNDPKIAHEFVKHIFSNISDITQKQLIYGFDNIKCPNYLQHQELLSLIRHVKFYKINKNRAAGINKNRKYFKYDKMFLDRENFFGFGNKTIRDNTTYISDQFFGFGSG